MARTSLDDDIRSPRKPNYDDPWVALAYLARYQLGHINLAYSTIKNIASRRGAHRFSLGGKEKLHFIDFGCGTLAGQFGIALTLADGLGRGQKITAVKVDSIDISETMYILGEKVWKRFAEYITENYPKTSIRVACDMIQGNFVTRKNYEEVDVLPDWDTWLTGFHAVYSTERCPVAEALKFLWQKHNPVAGAVTCYYQNTGPGNEKLRIARDVSPFPLDSSKELFGEGVKPQLGADRQAVALAQFYRELGLFAEHWHSVFWRWQRENREDTAFLIHSSIEYGSTDVQTFQSEMTGAVRYDPTTWPNPRRNDWVEGDEVVHLSLGRGVIREIKPRISEPGLMLYVGFSDGEPKRFPYDTDLLKKLAPEVNRDN